MQKHVLLFLIIILVIGCSDEQKKNGTGSSTDKIIAKANEATKKRLEQQAEGTVFRVPTPIEFYRFFKDAGGEFHKELMTPPEKSGHFISSKEKAIGFGVFASNLAYSAVYGQNQQTISYFETNKVLGEELGFLEGFGEELVKRFNNNLNNVDSLYQITTDSYWEVFKYLEDQDKTAILSYIIVSGWVESLYIAYNSIQEFDENELINCLADQLYVIENLYSYINSVHANEIEDDFVFQIVVDINNAYQELYSNPSDVIMTVKQFESIKKVVNDSRERLNKNSPAT